MTPKKMLSLTTIVTGIKSLLGVAATLPKHKDTNRKIRKTEFKQIHMWFQKQFLQQHIKHS